jgi:hypothetical protein
MAQRGWWGGLDATALATLLACLIALLVGILLAFLAFAVEKATSHPHCTADGRSHPGIACYGSKQRPSRRTRGAASQGALPRR